jgi:hypothetical protein
MDFRKDVFVSYSAGDLPWVDSELFRRLKDARVGYVEPRDFHPGTKRLKQIEKAIESCRRTLLIISQNYLSDSFAEFAGDMAFAFALENRSWSVIPVIKEENVKLPPSIITLVQSNLVAATEDQWRTFTSILSSDPPSDKIPDGTNGAPAENHVARSGLTLLLELMSNPDVKDALIVFKRDFELLSESMQKLKVLKGLHDKCQVMESSADVFARYAKADSGRPLYWEELQDPQIDLAEKIQELIDSVVEAEFAQSDDPWVVRLANARQESEDGTIGKQPDLLKAARRMLSSVLEKLPSKINLKMVDAARALRLSSLVRALMVVHEITQNLKASQLNKIEESANRIVKMELELKTVLYVHDFLQEVDTELRRLEASMEDVREVIEFSEEVNPKLQSICTGNVNDWAIKLSSAAAALRRSLPSGKIGPVTSLNEFSEVKRQFHLFRSQVTRSFNRVDGNMIRKCNEVEAEIQKPLAPLLALLQTE